MLGFLLSCVIFSVGVSSSQGESVYLTTLGGLAFHKVRVSGEMTNTNVKATCEGLGMRYPCFYRGGDRCSNSQFYNTDCVGFDTVSTNCATFNVIAYEVCPGVVNSYNCPALDDVFLYRRYWTSGDGAYGLDHQTTSYVSGAGQFNMWALCTDVDECSSSPCLGGGTCVDQIGGYTCDCPKGTAGDRCEAVVDGGSCYKFSPAPSSHFAAEKACRAEGGHLAVVKDPGKQRFLSNHIPAGNSDSHWIGTKVTSDKLVFSDQPSVFDQVAGLDWAEDSPGMPCALCVLLDNADGHKAKTTSCMEQHSYICQSETAPCEHNVCLHGGNCSSCFGGTDTVCTCRSGFDGKFCENHVAIQWCSVASCPPGWTCDDQLTHFLCIGKNELQT
ncbi:PREDICTED: fibropellin-1-like [Branchiostoma belcheri]|uniref:Fibropellin-1-like n=1 Tax=Branchiostoma belcheri TaxID=7741 RepID=A0A6P4YSA0_BRABE|nr:PREDICTED: fibropellin-1-like [Branchiostoma belcheri]